MLTIFFVSFLLFNCTATLTRKDIPDPGTYKQKLDISLAGQKRSYHLHIPEKFDHSAPKPLVIVLHGAFGNARQIEKQSGFSDIADREGFLVAYPNGGFGLFGFFQHWNAGHCCGKAQSDGVDDVSFIECVIDDIEEKFMVDSSRIYMVGFSNGGMMTYRFAAEKTNILAAAAPMAASLGGRASSRDSLWITTTPQAALPLIIFHSEDDVNVPYKGGTSPKKGGEREYVSVEKSIHHWIKNNGCEIHPRVAKSYNNQIIHKIWQDTVHNNDIELYLLKIWGHKWPGRFFTNKLDQTDPLYEFDAAEIIWQFFKKHHRRKE